MFFWESQIVSKSSDGVWDMGGEDLYCFRFGTRVPKVFICY